MKQTRETENLSHSQCVLNNHKSNFNLNILILHIMSKYRLSGRMLTLRKLIRAACLCFYVQRLKNKSLIKQFINNVCISCFVYVKR